MSDIPTRGRASVCSLLATCRLAEVASSSRPLREMPMTRCGSFPWFVALLLIAAGPTLGRAEPAQKAEPMPTEGELDRLARDVLGPQMEHYAERGFRDYEFGMTRKQAEALSPLRPGMGSWLEN